MSLQEQTKICFDEATQNQKHNPAGIYLFKVNNGNFITMCET